MTADWVEGSTGLAERCSASGSNDAVVLERFQKAVKNLLMTGVFGTTHATA
jgi:hypothetical protein